jgi:hypothetical protein
VVGDATVFASTTWDPDGPGGLPPWAVFGGTFVAAGNVAARSVAAWDGTTWHALGEGLGAQVRALTVFNGELIAAAGNGTFGGTGPANGVARWDGTSWHALGSAGFQNVVRTLAVFNGELVAGGLFTSAGGTPVNNIARWNGVSWQPLGTGNPNGVSALRVFNGQLLAAGIGVRRWTGTSWVAFGPNLTGTVNTLAIYQDELVAGGSFQTTPGGPTDEVARWDGAAWQPVGGGMNDSVNTLVEFHEELVAGGLFTTVEGVSAWRMARWNGVSWSPVFPGPGIPARRCDTLVIYNGELYAGGAGVKPSGMHDEEVGRWTGAKWEYVGNGIDAVVYDLATYHDDLIVGGWFSTAGDIAAHGIARRDSAGVWHDMGGIIGGEEFVFDLVVYDDVLLASGSFNTIGGVPVANLAQWDGVTWQPFGGQAVGKLLVHDGELYAPGSFGPQELVARWNPAVQNWQPIGAFPPNSGITCLTMFNGDLIAGGIGGIGVNASVWRWDFDAPGTWQPVGQHLGYGLIQTLGVYNGELLVGGYSDSSGGPPEGLARFNGSAWAPLGGGLYLGNESPDEILAVFDLREVNGDLMVAGTFSYAGAQQYTPDAVAAFHVARWDGTNWHALGTGTNDAVVSLHEHKGDLLVAGGQPNGHWARWGPVLGDMNGSGTVDLEDVDAFVGCVAGPGGSAAGGCDCADADFDGDVDLRDFGGFQQRWAGS